LTRASAITASPRASDRLAAAIARLEDAGIATARLEAEWLLAHALGVGRFEIYLALDRELPDAARDLFDAAIARRARGEPLQQIVGWESFRGLRVRVTRDVLVPRPETESLVEWALELLPPGPRRVVDVGTGSGCIAAAIASVRGDARVLALDVSLAAARVACDNARALDLGARVDVIAGDVLMPIRSRSVDLVVANPPYVSDGDEAALPREVRDWEPIVALYGGTDGLRVLTRIVDDARRVLVPGGVLVVETAGEPQVDAVAARVSSARYIDVAIRADLTGRRRFVAGRRVEDWRS
jgi:release factor glutamine methyltransferase